MSIDPFVNAIFERDCELEAERGEQCKRCFVPDDQKGATVNEIADLVRDRDDLLSMVERFVVVGNHASGFLFSEARALLARVRREAVSQ